MLEVDRTLWILNFFDRCSKDTQIPSFMKIGPVRTELFHADRRTDRHDDVDSYFS